MIKHKNRKLYIFFTSKKFCNGDIQIILIEEINVKNKNELMKIENEHIQRELNNIMCLNTFRAAVDQVSTIKNRKKYYENNKEKINEHNRKYYDENKEYIQQYDRERRKTDERKLYMDETFNCECGSTYSRTSKSIHFNTKTHQNFVLNCQKSKSIIENTN